MATSFFIYTTDRQAAIFLNMKETSSCTRSIGESIIVPGVSNPRRNDLRTIGPASPCCSNSSSRSIQRQSYISSISNGGCSCSHLTNSRRDCSDARRDCSAARRNSVCSCSCYLSGHRKWLEYLWKQGTERQHKAGCECCDVHKNLRQFSPYGEPCKCPCTDAGHKTHYFCNATDQNVQVSRLAALRYKIRKSTKWLVINLTIFMAVFFDDGFPTIFQAIVTAINFLNVCYYVKNLVKLHVAVARIKLERPANRTRNCLWEKNLPRDITRYFEDRSEEFFGRYCLYFSSLVTTLRAVRSSPKGRLETEAGMIKELKLEESMLRTHCLQLRAKCQFEDAKYRVPLMKRTTKQPICTKEQLEKYWRNYNEAYEDEKVRLSKEQLPFRPDVPSSSSTPGDQSPAMRNKCEERAYHEVAVSPVLKKSRYQYARDSDFHPSPAVSSASFFDFMKVHHRVDYCRSFKWVSNMKIWLSGRIKEVVEQFDMANEMLSRIGADRSRIGISSIADLQVALGRNEELLTFTPLLAFLNLTHNQSYLVSRYRALASQPCLTSYRWRSGGYLRGHWTLDTGPSDPEIVLHFFCSYMDMKLPDLPFHPTKKRPFSDHYVTSRPQEAVGDIAIVRQWVDPPHFNVAAKGLIYEIPGGSNNLFLALSYLIYCIKIYQQGKIGRISLDQPGLNMLWILGNAT